MVKPVTANGYISGSVNVNTVQSYAGCGAGNTDPLYAPYAPMYNLGAYVWEPLHFIIAT